MKARRTANLEAYDLFLKGMQALKSTRPALTEQAGGYFDRAIALDRDYADAWAAKGRALHDLGGAGTGHSHIPAAVYPDAIAALRRALEIEPGHAFATGWLGVALMRNDYKWAEGMQLIRQSLARNPNDAALLSVYGWYMNMMQIEGADEVVHRAYRLDPFGIVPIVVRAAYLKEDGRVLDALALMEANLIEDQGYAPNYFSAMWNLAIGRLDAAEEHVHKARQVAHPVDLSLDALGWAIDGQRGKGPPPSAEIGERLQTERLSFAVYGAWLDLGKRDEKAIVALYDLAIEQRHHELHPVLFGPKPPLMPEADWRRMKEITGVTQFQQAQLDSKQ